MTRPQIDNRISIGTLFAIVTALLSAAGVFFTLQNQVKNVTDRAEENREIIQENTRDIRQLERFGAAWGQKLEGIENSTRRTERMLEKLLNERRD